MPIPTHCPKCQADFDAGPIPEKHRDLYEGGTDRFSRVVSVQSWETDRHQCWECPDCGHRW